MCFCVRVGECACVSACSVMQCSCSLLEMLHTLVLSARRSRTSNMRPKGGTPWDDVLCVDVLFAYGRCAYACMCHLPFFNAFFLFVPGRHYA